MPTVIDLARSQLGTRYVWGGAEPGGFDCSGLVKWCYAQLGVTLPHYTDAIAGATTSITDGQQSAGDLILYRYSDPEQPGTVYPHMGLVEAPGLTIDAAYPAGVTEHAPFGYPHEYRRVGAVAPSSSPASSTSAGFSLPGLPDVGALLSSPWARVAAVGGLAYLAFGFLNPGLPPLANPSRCPVCRNPAEQRGCDPSRRFCAFWSGRGRNRVLRPIRASVGYSREVEKMLAEQRREGQREALYADVGRGAERESGIVRPPYAWARRLSLEALADIARDAGVSPYSEAWWDTAELRPGGFELRERQGVKVRVKRRRSGEYQAAVLEGRHRGEQRRSSRRATSRGRTAGRLSSAAQRASWARPAGADIPF